MKVFILRENGMIDSNGSTAEIEGVFATGEAAEEYARRFRAAASTLCVPHYGFKIEEHKVKQ
tara:strand:+ start:221 stop:406 length:186 start_codon:yes stop_codon:yes gene_type:complete